MELRASVDWFSQEMERELRHNDHKPGWIGDDLTSLLFRVYDEVRELREALSDEEMDPVKVIAEAADVANMAMMIADNVKPLLETSYPLDE